MVDCLAQSTGPYRSLSHRWMPGKATTVSLRPYDHVEATPTRWTESRRVNKCASLEAWRQPKTSVIRTREK